MSASVRKPKLAFAPITQRLMSGPQAAAYLGMSMASFNRRVIDGEIPVVWVKGRGTRKRRMFDKADLDRYIEANKGKLGD